MSSSKPAVMRCRKLKLSCLLSFILWELQGWPIQVSSLEVIPVYNTTKDMSQDMLFFSKAGRRQHLLETATLISNSPSIPSSAPPSFFRPTATTPAPLPALFPSDPPVTVPYSPAPQTFMFPTGNCSINFTAFQATFYQTANDCGDPFAAYVGVAICCPQFDSLLRIIQGQHISATGVLGLNNTEAEYCFSETVNALSVYNVSKLCDVSPANLSVGSCPVTTVEKLELLTDTNYLLQTCHSMDRLKECSLHRCQFAIGNATLDLAQGSADAFDDCESLVVSWLTSKSTPVQANTILRFLSSCIVNKVCPLDFKDTSPVARACNSTTPSKSTCCGALDEYVQNELQTQMLITNEQAFRCASLLGRDLQNLGVGTDIYTLCQIDLRDFSLQAQGKEGCLLPSQPTEINITSGTPYFICDLNDNILAQWPPIATVVPSRASSLYIGSPWKVVMCVFAVVLSMKF